MGAGIGIPGQRPTLHHRKQHTKSDRPSLHWSLPAFGVPRLQASGLTSMSIGDEKKNATIVRFQGTILRRSQLLLFARWRA